MLFFFFKQKTAYEMRISDWSSDVCSSDLLPASLLPVKRTLSALMTMTLSPQSTFGVKLVLCLPRRTLAMIVDARPRSEARRVGKGCVSTCSYRLSLFPLLINTLLNHNIKSYST